MACGCGLIIACGYAQSDIAAEVASDLVTIAQDLYPKMLFRSPLSSLWKHNAAWMIFLLQLGIRGLRGAPPAITSFWLTRRACRKWVMPIHPSCFVITDDTTQACLAQWHDLLRGQGPSQKEEHKEI